MKTLKNYIDSVVNKVLRESLDERADEIINKLKSNVDESDDTMEGETCEQCGGMMTEGECSECGYKMENMMEESDSNSDKCEYHMQNFGKDDERTQKFCGTTTKEMGEGLSKKQSKFIDKNKNGAIDKEDFKLLHKKRETKEGKKFPDLSGDGKVTRKDVLMGRGVKLNGKKTSVKESIKLTENEMIDLIEKVVKEEKSNISKGAKHPGTTATDTNLKKSKKENDDYISSVTKKMKDYLKQGSKGDFSFEPKMFPKGNGELGEMDKKTYKPTKEVEEYIENFASAGQENIVFDEIHPDEQWMTDNIEGSSRTGNNPKWANAVETDVNKKVNDRRKKNLLGYLKKKESYNKSPQPVYMVDQEDSEFKSQSAKDVRRIFTKLESTEDKKDKMIKEEIEKMNHILGYKKKTQ